MIITALKRTNRLTTAVPAVRGASQNTLNPDEASEPARELLHHQLRPHGVVVHIHVQLESEFLANRPHLAILG